LAAISFVKSHLVVNYKMNTVLELKTAMLPDLSNKQGIT